MTRKTFWGYGRAAEEIARRAADEGRSELMSVEIIEMGGISLNRFNMIVNSALFHAMCPEPRSGASMTGRGSALYYRVSDFVRLLEALRDPEAQSVLVVDYLTLSDSDFEAKYGGKTKGEVFDGEHRILETDNPAFN